MKKIYFSLAISIIIATNNTFAEMQTNNLDNIEITGYFHTTMLSGDGCIGGDFRFKGENSIISKYSELKGLGDIISTNFSCYGVSIGTLDNNLKVKSKIIGNNGKLVDSNSDYSNPMDINKTGSGEYIIIPSKNFVNNLLKNDIFIKNDIFKGSKDKDDLGKKIQDLNFSGTTSGEGKMLTVKGKFYKIKGNYEYSDPFFGDKKLDMDLNIIIADDMYITKPIKADENKVNKFKQKFANYMKGKAMLDDEFENFKSKILSNIEKTKNKLNKDSVNYLTLEEIKKYIESTGTLDFLFD